MYSEDDELVGDQFSAFSEKNVRLGFIRKVYGILLCQIVVTLLVMVMFMYIEPVKEYSMHNPWIWYTALAVTFVTLIILVCCDDVRRKTPMNLIFLGIFTLCESILLGAVTSHYDEVSVLLAVGITAGVCLALTLFAFQTKFDFTMCGGLLFVFLVILVIFGIFAAIFHNKVLSVVYASLGALLFSFYLVFDTQLMLGGKHKYSLSPEEYIFAALNLYLDIINLFLLILSLVGNARN
ncbi:protein lifeguard 1-like [Saccostrea echinata]|uniref:protein lifeguard 1-like n=1 Tax=Saccostrea echinata TaxID=191078 RepID=UPI002A841BE9|nr:protein lifeguard 1-like [Saccostrea echinata]